MKESNRHRDTFQSIMPCERAIPAQGARVVAARMLATLPAVHSTTGE